jgi:hypothetical protein
MLKLGCWGSLLRRELVGRTHCKKGNPLFQGKVVKSVKYIIAFVRISFQATYNCLLRKDMNPRDLGNRRAWPTYVIGQHLFITRAPSRARTRHNYFIIRVKARSYLVLRRGGPQNIVCRLENTRAKAASLPGRKNALLDNGEEQRAKGKNE